MNPCQRETLLHVSLDRMRFKDKTCSNSQCYSDLCASDKTRGAVGSDWLFVVIVDKWR
ncbi:hypothetical protein GFB56_29870 [Ensifer sp. T173]|uniref:Uncharacterized protein n=1 Tax=Ensifer canadensis TaxID=555315 RepID=A0AAW4FUI4_9HYPH|nr:hypothetical protein [Ensifer canadensis]